MIASAQDFSSWNCVIEPRNFERSPFGDGEHGLLNGEGYGSPYLNGDGEGDDGCATEFLLCVDNDDLGSVANNTVCRMRP